MVYSGKRISVVSFDRLLSFQMGCKPLQIKVRRTSSREGVDLQGERRSRFPFLNGQERLTGQFDGNPLVVAV